MRDDNRDTDLLHSRRRQHTADGNWVNITGISSNRANTRILTIRHRCQLSQVQSAQIR